MSVVIPTRDRDALLALTLEALATQTIAKDRLEVVVVRDAEQGGDGPKLPADMPGQILPFTGDSRAAGSKRNLGWRHSRASLIAFTDDDCRPSSDWLERLLAEHDGHTIIQGRTEVDPGQLHEMRGFARTQQIVGGSPWYETCNIAYPRSLLEAVGGFDEEFIIDGEDTDLALRVLEAGGLYRYLDDAVVWHAVHRQGALGAVRSAGGWTSLPLLFNRHPDHRRHLLVGAFRNEAHASLTFAVLVSAAGRNRIAFAIGIAPYIGRMLASELTTNGASFRSLARFAAYLPARAAIDAAGLFATARGALHHRAFML